MYNFQGTELIEPHQELITKLTDDGFVQLKKKSRKKNTVDSVTLYLNDIGRFKLLTAKEEQHYATLASAGDIDAKHQLIKSNLRLVVKIAKGYVDKGLDFLDLIEQGNLGLMRAVEKFDPKLGFRFSTYACNWIKQSIDLGIKMHAKNIYIPCHILLELNVYLKKMSELTSHLLKQANIKDVALSLDKPEARVKKLLNLPGTISLNIPCNYEDEDEELEDIIPDEEGLTLYQKTHRAQTHEKLKECLQLLPKRECYILTERFGFRDGKCKKLKDVSKIMGITTERARQMQVVAIELLKPILISKNLTLNALSYD